MAVDMKERIAASFAALAQKKPVDKITVKELVERCGISRQTFYYHFQDLLEVMQWQIERILQQAVESSLHAENSLKGIEGFISISLEHQELLGKLLASQRRAQVERIFVRAMRESIREMILQKKPDWAVDAQDWEVTLNFYAYGMAGVVFENSQSVKLGTEKLAQKLYRLLAGQMLEV